MAFADMMKPSNEKSQATKEMMRNGLVGMGVNPDEYTITYGYFMKKGLLKKTMYNYIVALSKDENCFIIIPINSNGNYGEPTKFEASQISASKVTLQGEFKFDVEGVVEQYKIMIPPFTTKDAESNYQFQIVQDDESAIIRNFFKKR